MLDWPTRISNWVFTGIFTAEAIVKLIALRQHYFKKAWNVFDFIIVVSSVIGNVLLLSAISAVTAHFQPHKEKRQICRMIETYIVN